jgi:hypothetical protein
MYSVQGLPHDSVFKTPNLDMAMSVAQWYVLTEEYFEGLGLNELNQASLEWIIEE